MTAAAGTRPNPASLQSQCYIIKVLIPGIDYKIRCMDGHVCIFTASFLASTLSNGSDQAGSDINYCTVEIATRIRKYCLTYTYLAAPSDRESIRDIPTLPKNKVAIITSPGPITISSPVEDISTSYKN